MIFILFSTVLGWLCYLFFTWFEYFKFMHKDVPKKVTKTQVKRLKSAMDYALQLTILQTSFYRWHVDLLLCVTSWIVMDPFPAFILLIASIVCYFVSRDLPCEHWLEESL